MKRLHDSAALIQNTYRRHIAKKLRAARDRQRDREIQKRFFDSMAIQIQKVWRGYRSRVCGIAKNNLGRRKMLLQNAQLAGERLLSDTVVHNEMSQQYAADVAAQRAKETVNKLAQSLHYMASTATLPGVFSAPRRPGRTLQHSMSRAERFPHIIDGRPADHAPPEEELLRVRPLLAERVITRHRGERSTARLLQTKTASGVPSTLPALRRPSSNADRGSAPQPASGRTAKSRSPAGQDAEQRKPKPLDGMLPSLELTVQGDSARPLEGPSASSTPVNPRGSGTTPSGTRMLRAQRGSVAEPQVMLACGVK
jgi:hypothetical protein